MPSNNQPDFPASAFQHRPNPPGIFDVQADVSPESERTANGKSRNGRKTRKAKGKKPGRPKSRPAAVAVAPAARRPRKARAIKIELAIAASIFSNLKQNEANILGAILSSLNTLNKKSRQRVLMALGKVYA